MGGGVCETAKVRFETRSGRVGELRVMTAANERRKMK